MDPGVSVLLAFTGGAVAFVVGLIQYRHAQRWKRAEFVANEMRAFKADRLVHNALLMLDWNERLVDLFPYDPDSEEEIWVTDQAIAAALVPHTIRSNFTPIETALRDTFDRFFDDLERFEYFMQAGLVSKAEFEPYLSYWVRILGDEKSGRKPPEVVRALWRYMDFYFAGVVELLQRYGYDISGKLQRDSTRD